jgi:hypothetical protein
MATGITNKAAQAQRGEQIDQAHQAAPAQRKGIPFTVEQSEILGQVYRLILRWGKNDLLPGAAATARKES